MPAKRSADANHCFQSFRSTKLWVGWKSWTTKPTNEQLFPNRISKKPTNQKLLVQIEHDLASILLLFLAGWRYFHGNLQYDTNHYQYVPWHPLMGEWWSFRTNFLQTASPLTGIIDGLLNHYSYRLGFWEVLCCCFSNVERRNCNENKMDGSSCLDILVCIHITYNLRWKGPTL